MKNILVPTQDRNKKEKLRIAKVIFAYLNSFLSADRDGLCIVRAKLKWIASPGK